VDRPIFLIGMPRSGTTVIFEAFAAREDLAWLSKHLERAPGALPLAVLSRLADVTPKMRRSVSRTDQIRPALERLRVGPAEAYGFWERLCGEKFRYDYLHGVTTTPGERRRVSEAISKVARYQGKTRFAAKVTGPARIGFLSSIFPDARFVHVVRDGRAVVQSLMRVYWWKERNRMHVPAWRNGLTERDLADLRRYKEAPEALAGVQWRRVVEMAREEAAALAPDRYAEAHYERFVSAPQEVLGEIASFCDLPPSRRAEDFLESRFELRDMNFQWRERFDGATIAMLDDLIGDALAEFGYRVDPPGFAADGPMLATPFART
jgi:omega-hydroxy-beta-dihydromenaquinone-9 sulfotransferase